MQSRDSSDFGEQKQLVPPEFPAILESASLEALGRILGYTQKQLALAGDTLSRFSWRSPSEPGQSTQRTGAASDDSNSSRKRAA